MPIAWGDHHDLARCVAAIGEDDLKGHSIHGIDCPRIHPEQPAESETQSETATHQIHHSRAGIGSVVLPDSVVQHQRHELLSWRSSTLPFGPKTIGRVGCGMFGFPARHPSTPQTKGGWFELLTHHGDHLLLVNPELIGNGFKGRPVLPSHFDNSIQIR